MNTYRDLIEHVARDYDETPENLERHYLEVYRLIVAAYWNENDCDWSEIPVPIKAQLIAAYKVGDTAEFGRLFCEEMAKMPRELIAEDIASDRSCWRPYRAREPEDLPTFLKSMMTEVIR